jgi:pantoate--beta-alanine ligase
VASETAVASGAASRTYGVSSSGPRLPQLATTIAHAIVASATTAAPAALRTWKGAGSKGTNEQDDLACPPMSSVIVLKEPDQLRRACDEARAKGRAVGFIPTMGALHEGHLALCREAKQRTQSRGSAFVVCSIFVNPTQFGPGGEDLARYPRDLAGDVEKLAPTGVDAVFAPEPDAMYPKDERTRVRVDGLTAHLCGPHRPGHFEGVTTIVAKLFALVGPSIAIFGKKDYQQLVVIRRMTRDLFLPVDVVGHPIIREPDGLAMSSRNAYLSSEERERALGLSRGLSAAVRAFATGERRAGVLRNAALAAIEPIATSIDYVTVADADAIEPFADGDETPERVLLAVACRVGTTRLIDNVVLGEDPPPTGPAVG